MRNGIEYSKSKLFRIKKGVWEESETEYYTVQQLIGTAWINCPNGPWTYLNNARADMQRIERILCPQ